MSGRLWLEEHLETFVKPHTNGVVPPIDPNSYYLRVFIPSAFTFYKKVWEAAKKRSGGRQMLLAGRDVYFFEVMARLEDYPTIFRSDISSHTKDHVKEDYSKCFMLDTGYKGSVARALRIPNFMLVCYRPGSTGRKAGRVKERREVVQAFPSMGMHEAHDYAANLETSPKYWQQAYFYREATQSIPAGIYQRMDTYNFTHAAQLTQLIAKVYGHSKPKVHRVMSIGRGI